MNANNPKAPPPAPRPGPICPNCERSGGRHFPACPLEGAPAEVRAASRQVPVRVVPYTIRHAPPATPMPGNRLALEGSEFVEYDRRTGREVARHKIPGVVQGCDRCHGGGTTVEDGLVVRCTHCGGTGGH